MKELSEQDIKRIHDAEEQGLRVGEYEKILLSKHEKILIGNALQAYCMYLHDTMNNFAPTDGAKKYLAKCLEDAEQLQDKFTEW